MDVICNLCYSKLEEAGALLFSPPNPYNFMLVEKIHICKKCYDYIYNTILFVMMERGLEFRNEMDILEERKQTVNLM